MFAIPPPQSKFSDIPARSTAVMCKALLEIGEEQKVERGCAEMPAVTRRCSLASEAALARRDKDHGGDRAPRRAARVRGGGEQC